MNVIDVWDCATFDAQLMDQLESDADEMLRYFQTDHRIFLEHDLGRGTGRSTLRPDNPHAESFSRIREAVAEALHERTIRAWHYTRLTDVEVEVLRREGVHLSTPESLRQRLDALVTAGDLSLEAANELYVRSPFHSSQLDGRVNRFWMTSHPIDVDDGGVEPLMKHWGGEVASMWVRDETLTAHLSRIGRPRIIELAVPVRLADCGFSAARAVVAAFVRSRGGIPDKFAFDLRVTSPLPAAAVLAVHTEGESTFAGMARGHPASFVDVSIGRWKELTGEDD
jgi:hypothetical protein